MRTVFGREMPAHCALYFDAAQATRRRLSCLKLTTRGRPGQPEAPLVRLGPRRRHAGRRAAAGVHLRADS